MLKRCVFILLGFFSTAAAIAQAEEREADLKAVFIYNFTKYIEWDSSNTDNSFVIGILGSTPVASSLTEIAKVNMVGDKKIVVRRWSRPEDIRRCHILFISRNSGSPLRSVLAKTGKGILTISEEEGYANLGTALNFIIRNDKLKFEANLKAISDAGLNAGSQLLKLAVIIN